MITVIELACYALWIRVARVAPGTRMDGFDWMDQRQERRLVRLNKRVIKLPRGVRSVLCIYTRRV